MSLKYHKAITDDGGAIGNDISSGEVGNLLRKILLSEQTSGVVIPRKLYLVNEDVVDVDIVFNLEEYSFFEAILFESTGDAQVVGDLTGLEVDESPILVTIPASGHKSFWLQVNVPASSTVTNRYNTIDTKTTQEG